ncbi:SpoIIE family protein phosphatase [Streptomyces sp. WMMC500]|uniref:SpoIIE family protein phosphatase n=1 Tax=Streptomyces sp. WMMC500 TaxID=3015154 RepID=UPI00248AB31C|nr:SpoIIE family protein phosphatase [Streptomyces sp. WMMC500]WBB62487.1 SpoIIE family protein phosphatase [Streptomyces sp. WMMC500]
MGSRKDRRPEASGGEAEGYRFDITDAAVVVDSQGLVQHWNEGAEALFGYAAADAVAHPVTDILSIPWEKRWETAERNPAGRGWTGSFTARHRDGSRLRVRAQVCPLGGDHRASWLIVATSLATAHEREREQAILRGLFSQSPFGLTVVDPQLRVVMVNPALERMEGVPARLRLGRALGDTVPEEVGPIAEAHAREVLETGEPRVAVSHVDPPVASSSHLPHVRSRSSFRLQDPAGRTLGMGQAVLDVTGYYQARRHLTLISEAGIRIGSTLDLDRTAQEFAEVLVPQVADFVAVDLSAAVVHGHEPDPVLIADSAELIRRAQQSIREDIPESVTPAGTPVTYSRSSPQQRCVTSGRSVLEPTVDLSTSWLSQDAVHSDKLKEVGIHSLLVVPLRARGITMGVATLVRWKNPEAFDADDLLLVEELAAHAAVCVDNARRFGREHRAALSLQRHLLPKDLPTPTGVEVAYRYLPADTHAGVGGDWFDVLPLSGGRIGLVVGDVVGHGMKAAATMGRLRTAVQTLADLDLPPDELVAHLDDLVSHLDEAEAGDRRIPGVIGATCVYCVYDPISRTADITRAGHPPPAIAHPDKAVEFLDIPAGPPLGLGGLPFESTHLTIPDGSVLAFYTDGLITASPDRDIDLGFTRLAFALAYPDRPLEEICDVMERLLLPDHPRDDVAFLVARPRSIDEENVATWHLPRELTAVGQARSLTTEQLDAWHLDDLASTAELIVSELVTNAIRHASGPVDLRLIRDVNLILEVSDGSHTSPHLRQAAIDDEGGRGLFLVAQFAQSWGTRYTTDGKTIWAEQHLPPGVRAGA